MTDRALIDQFLSGRRIAFVGVSRHEADFSRIVFRELAARGFDVVPVHPNVDEIEGRRTYARITDIPGHVDGALLMTPPEVTEDVVRDCVAADVRRVWMHRGAGGPGAVSSEAVAYCAAHGIDVVAGECPLMFVRNSSLPHRMHALLRRAEGRYPVAGRGPAVELDERAAGLVAASFGAWVVALLVPLDIVSTPLVFALVAAVYGRWRGHVAPLAAGGVIVGTAAVLEAFYHVVVERSPRALLAPMTWLPLVLAFIAVVVVATWETRAPAPARGAS